MPDNTSYAYSVARIRAVESKMLDKGKLDGMINARSADDAFKILKEAEYGFLSGQDEDAGDYEKVLKQENEKVCALLKKISPFPDAFDIFLYKNDYHNVKVILKGEFLGHIDDTILVNSGTIRTASLKDAVIGRKLGELPETLRLAIEEAIDDFSRTRDPQVIDLNLDKALYNQMAGQAKELKEPFVTGLIEIMTDISNIVAFLRTRKLKNGHDIFKRAFLHGGRLEEALFLRNFGNLPENFINEVKNTPYGRMCEESAASYTADGSLKAFEKQSDNYIINYIRKAKYISLGIEPLVAYFLAKQFEMKNVGIIMAGKLNNLPVGIIRERLRDSYV